MTKLFIVVPCYNEEKVLPSTTRALSEKLSDLNKKGIISDESKIVYVDDGSTDNTWNIILEYSSNNSFIKGIKLSRNKGHQNALLCGLLSVKDMCDCAISIDADLQDDINVFDEMLEKYRSGADIVYGVRANRSSDKIFKRTTAHFFYKLLNLLGAEIIYNHADFRLLSSRALNALADFKEVNLFLRGLVPLVGFRSEKVYYERLPRKEGKSKYTLKKMLPLALDGLTSLSMRPLRLISALGVLVFLVSIIILIYSLVVHFMGNTVSGWTSLAVSIWAIGGLQLLAIGIVGEYIGKIYMETKERPRFIIEENLLDH